MLGHGHTQICTQVGQSTFCLVKYLCYFPKLVHQLASSLRMFASKFGKGLVASPHESWASNEAMAAMAHAVYTGIHPQISPEVPLGVICHSYWTVMARAAEARETSQVHDKVINDDSEAVAGRCHIAQECVSTATGSENASVEGVIARC